MAGRKAGTATQTVRLMATLRAILAAGRDGISTADLAAKMGITGRQMQRDLDALTGLGVDVMQHDFSDNTRRYSATRKQATAALLGGA